MKYAFLPIIALLLSPTLNCAAQTKTAVTATAPTSTVINADQLLRDLETLSSDAMEGRAPDTPGSVKAREYIVARFKAAGIEAFNNSYLQSFQFETSGARKEQRTGTNIIGYLKGAKQPEKYIVITAHYDHLGIRNNIVFNGADDNASGASALPAIAEYFKQKPPRHSIIFAAVDAEESGLRGARAFVAAPPVAKEAILMNINLDMISHSDKNELYAAGTFHYPFLKSPLETVVARAGVKLTLGHDLPELGTGDWTTQSDHYAFHEAKIPFVYFGVEDHKDYHQATDDFPTITPAFYVKAVETIIEAVKEFDRSLGKVQPQKITTKQAPTMIKKT